MLLFKRFMVAYLRYAQKSIIVLSFLLVGVLLVGCEDLTDEQSNELSYIQSVMLDSAVLDVDVTFEIDEDASYIGAYARIDKPVIRVTRGFINAYKSGKLSKNMVMFVIGHELGHLGKVGKTKAGTMSGEIFADYWSILLLEEMQDAGVNVDIYDAIKFFYVIPHGVGAGDSLHPHPLDRYKYLKAKLDEWKSGKAYRAYATKYATK